MDIKNRVQSEFTSTMIGSSGWILRNGESSIHSKQYIDQLSDCRLLKRRKQVHGVGIKMYYLRMTLHEDVDQGVQFLKDHDPSQHKGTDCYVFTHSSLLKTEFKPPQDKA
jgi:hypothetical protein